DPAGDFEPGHLRQLDIHQDQIGAQLADQIERLETIAGAGGLIAMRFQQVAKELHVELVVLHDQDGFGHPVPPLSQETDPAFGALAPSPDLSKSEIKLASDSL